jgi:chromatin assembly factor 1 subunit B
MKAETPQILWHNGQDNEQNKNAPIYSISLLESGMISRSQFGLVLCTAGNHEVNLWKLQLSPDEKAEKSDNSKNIVYSKLDRSTPMKLVKVELLTTLTRHDATVNAVQFSPNGLHLATASDAGTIIIYSVPPSKRGNGNGQHYWSEVDSESCLSLKILTGHDGIYDLDWSSDSRRFVVGTLDHTIAIYEDDSFAANAATDDKQKDSQWKCCYRNARDHSHYLQGVAMDPQGTYVATASCDRTVRVYARKVNKKKRQQAASNDKLELGKGKLIKYYTPPVAASPEVDAAETPTDDTTTKAPKRTALFAEEAASESFFRRLSFTTDGAYLITPAALWNDQAATLMFRRHCYDAPCKVLPGHDKVRIFVRRFARCIHDE